MKQYLDATKGEFLDNGTILNTADSQFEEESLIFIELLQAGFIGGYDFYAVKHQEVSEDLGIYTSKQEMIQI